MKKIRIAVSVEGLMLNKWISEVQEIKDIKNLLEGDFIVNTIGRKNGKSYKEGISTDELNPIIKMRMQLLERKYNFEQEKSMGDFGYKENGQLFDFFILSDSLYKLCALEKKMNELKENRVQQEKELFERHKNNQSVAKTLTMIEAVDEGIEDCKKKIREENEATKNIEGKLAEENCYTFPGEVAMANWAVASSDRVKLELLGRKYPFEAALYILANDNLKKQISSGTTKKGSFDRDYDSGKVARTPIVFYYLDIEKDSSNDNEVLEVNSQSVSYVNVGAVILNYLIHKRCIGTLDFYDEKFVEKYVEKWDMIIAEISEEEVRQVNSANDKGKLNEKRYFDRLFEICRKVDSTLSKKLFNTMAKKSRAEIMDMAKSCLAE